MGLACVVASLNLAWARAATHRLLAGRPHVRTTLAWLSLADSWLRWIAAAALGFVAAGWGQDMWAGLRDALANPMPLNAMEGRETVKAWLLAQGANIYPSMEGHPFLVTIYPPVYHAATAASALLTEWGIGAARLASFAAHLALAAMAGAFLLCWTRSRTAALGVALLALAEPVLAAWGIHARPDMLAWSLALGGAWAFLLASRGGRRAARLAVCSGLLFCLALYTKQQTLPWLLGCLAWGALAGPAGRRAVPWAAGTVLVSGGALLCGLSLAFGEGFLRDVFLYPLRMSAAAGVSSGENLLVRAMQVWEAFRPLWILGTLGAAASMLARRWELPAALLVMNVLFLPSLLASWGADVNYAFGALTASLLAAGGLLARLERLRPSGRALALGALLLAVPSPGGIRDRTDEGSRRLAALDGPVLANTEGGHLFLGRRPGKEVVFFDAIETSLYEQAGFWRADSSALVRDIAARRFRHVALFGDFAARAVADALAVFYKASAQAGFYRVLVPDPAARVLRVGPGGGVTPEDQGAGLSVLLEDLAQETEGLAPAREGVPGFLRVTFDAIEARPGMEARARVRLAGGRAGCVLRDSHGAVLAARQAGGEGSRDLVLTARPGEGPVTLEVSVEGRAWLETQYGALAVLRLGVGD
ncbi:hypothetical protein [Fundidesulfovibrio magnetotacticus]|uniref:hypothetical protein n=1 Tax=Fundidesulfovibrio magnetotacticus TaxID=2730080 RepID=UPI001565BA7B|nr:hypothetical protein [Fundidesulfovibrio magnetotacticus]